MNMVDDAPSLTQARMGKEETIWEATGVLRAWIEKHGVPRALYTDWKIRGRFLIRRSIQQRSRIWPAGESHRIATATRRDLLTAVASRRPVGRPEIKAWVQEYKSSLLAARSPTLRGQVIASLHRALNR